jgi:hypothetical protein
MRYHHLRTALTLLALTIPVGLRAQDVELTTDVLDRFVTAYDREAEEIAALDPKLAEIDEKIRKFRECRIAFEAAGSATRSRLGGLAARAGVRAKCGANNESDIAKEKQVLLDKAAADAAQAGGFTMPQFTRLKTRLQRIYAYGDRAGLSTGEVAAVDARAERFGSIYGAGADMRAVAEALQKAGVGAGGAGMPMAGQWTADLTWMYVGQLFGMMYATGANVFDVPYAQGQWTRWQIGGDEDEDRMLVERAFLSRGDDGNEWWRFKAFQERDTIILEALFKPVGDGVQQLVRMRGKMPGEREANELLVPDHMTNVNSLGMFGMRPTKESVEGATVGTANIRTPAGSFAAQHLRFGGAGGRQEWWLSEQVPGGWVRYKVTPAEVDETFVMELVAHGTGATSELGVK